MNNLYLTWYMNNQYHISFRQDTNTLTLNVQLHHNFIIPSIGTQNTYYLPHAHTY